MADFGNREDFWRFVDEHLGDDTAALRMRARGQQFPFDVALAIEQIDCRRTLNSKLLSTEMAQRFLVPCREAVEQASAVAVASWHSSLADATSNVIDLTGGLGLDAFAMAKVAQRVTVVEMDPLRAMALRENVAVQGLENVTVVESDCLDFLKRDERVWDVAFIDPARRDNAGSRKYALADCLPDVVGNLPLILKHCKRLMIKASPMLDVEQVKRELPEACSITAVSLDGECKELLVEIDSANIAANKMEERAIALYSSPEKRRVAYEKTGTGSEAAEYADGDWKWLYEPDAALMKLSDWKGIPLRWKGLRQAAPSTHLYLSEQRVDGFMGRSFKIHSFDASKDEMKALKGKRMMVSTRNHPLRASEARKKLGLREGDREVVWGFRYRDGSGRERPLWVIGERDEEGR